MLTRADFDESFRRNLEKYPTLAARYDAGDPALRQQVEAIFTAMAMQSAAQEVALAEPQVKSRPATILADAALRGIIPRARPGIVVVAVDNQSEHDFTVTESRTVIDPSGQYYRAVAAQTVAAGQVGNVTFEQVRGTSFVHQVTESAPFYAIQVPTPDDGSHLCGIRVFDAANQEFEFANSYVGVSPGDRVYHIQSNANQVMFVQFGDNDTVGHQPDSGDDIRVDVDYSYGSVDLAPGAPFEFEYVSAAPGESDVNMTLSSVLEAGAPPPSIDYIRTLCQYPALYDDDAVYGGEFDLLVRKHHPDAEFLNVWNEAVDEDYRGYNIANTNSLFVSVYRTDEELAATPEEEGIIASGALTDYQRSIEQRVLRADDTLRVRFRRAVNVIVPITVTATIPTSYSRVVVAQAIRELLMQEYGRLSNFARRGGTIKNRVVVDQLVSGIPALRADDSDVIVELNLTSDDERPEVWSYVTADSITTNVTNVATLGSGW